MNDDEQRTVDTFYWSNGMCCAGCDWWQHLNEVTGLCTRSAPMPAEDRVTMIGMHDVSMQIGGGHPFTPREHRCGDFQDNFDWPSLPLAYRRSVGCDL